MNVAKTLKLEVDATTARLVLAQMEQQVEDKRTVRDGLDIEIETLEKGCKALRDQMNNGSDSERQPRGDNKARIKEYLSKMTNEKGARASKISKDTGVGMSSTAFTLAHYKEDFIRDDETKRWKLKAS